MVLLLLPSTLPQLPAALYPWPDSCLSHSQCARLPLLHRFHCSILLLPIDQVPIPLTQQWRREYSQGERCRFRSTRTGIVHNDFESILAFFMGVREKENKAGEGRVGDCGRLCTWDRVCDWDSDEEGAGWRQRCRNMGLD